MFLSQINTTNGANVRRQKPDNCERKRRREKKKRDQRKKAKKRRAKYIYIPPTFICIYRERERERGSEGKGGKLNRRARNRPRELRQRRTSTARRTKPSRKPQQPYRCHQSFFSRRSISLFFSRCCCLFFFSRACSFSLLLYCLNAQSFIYSFNNDYVRFTSFTETTPSFLSCGYRALTCTMRGLSSTLSKDASVVSLVARETRPRH